MVKMLHIDYHARTHHIHGLVAENSGRQKVQNELSLFVYDRVSRVVSALITDYYIIFFTEKVNHTALSFITPVCSDYCC